MKIISDLVNIKKYQFSRSLITITRSKMKNSKKQPFLTKFDIFHANWTKINNTGFLGLLITILRSKMKNSIWQPFFGLKSTLFVQIAQKWKKGLFEVAAYDSEIKKKKIKVTVSVWRLFLTEFNVFLSNPLNMNCTKSIHKEFSDCYDSEVRMVRIEKFKIANLIWSLRCSYM